MARATKEEKALAVRIERIYGQACSGVQIPLMSIPKVFAIGRTAALLGGDDETVKAAIVAFVETIRTN
jgi:hypothetical protein